MEINKDLLGNPWDIIDNLHGSESNDLFELDDILVKISLKLINYRLNYNMTQKQLAEKLGISQAMVSKLESGEYNPTIELLWRVSKKLGWSFDILLNEDEEMHIWDTNGEAILETSQTDGDIEEELGERLGESA